MTVGVQTTLYLKGSEWQTREDKLLALGLGSFLVMFPTWVCIWLTFNHKNLMSRAYRNKFEYMYLGIHNHRSKWNKYYFPIAMYRRMLFVSFPTFLYNYPVGQMVCLILCSTVYIIVYGKMRPHWDRRRFRMELYNEVMIMCFNYHTVIFSDFCINAIFQF